MMIDESKDDLQSVSWLRREGDEQKFPCLQKTLSGSQIIFLVDDQSKK